jgi:peptidylprolyl isomerase
VDQLQQGTLVLVDYIAKVKDTGEVLEVTREEDAKNLSVFDPAAKYEPKLVAVGEQWVMKGLDEALLKAEPGDKMSVEIPPEKGFGLRDPTKIRLIPIRRFGDDASKLKVGEQIEVDNRIGTVRFIGSGRVQVDFNHRLAGKTITYDFHVLRTLTEPKEIILALIHRRVPVDISKVGVELANQEVTIELPQEVFFMDGLQYTKRAVADEIFKFIKDITKVIFVERFENPEAKKSEEQKQTEPQDIKGEEAEAKELKPKAISKRATKRKATETK